MPSSDAPPPAPPPAPGTVTTPAPPPAPGTVTTPAKPARRSRTAMIAILATVGTAVAGAVAGAIITPERFEAMFSAPVSTPDPIEFKTATDPLDAITLSVPTTWAVGLASYIPGLDDVREEGAAVLAGTQVGGSVVHGESTAYVGASVVTPRRLELVGESEAVLRQWLQEKVAEPDWTIEDCVLVDENTHAIEGWLSASRLWKDCASLEGARLLEWFALTPDGAVMQVGQILLAPDVPDGALDTIVESVVVRPERLPDKPPHGVVP